jgi:ADP-heptose:LPS heptosyltransferase
VVGAVAWRVGLIADLLRGPVRRHRARASLRGLWRRRAWRARVRKVHAEKPGRQVIAIAMVEHLGDVVATEPVVRHVRAANPEAYIIDVVRDTYRELADANPNVDEVLTVRCLTEWMHLARGRVFDRTVDLQIPGRVCPVCNVRLVNPTADKRIAMNNYYHHGNLLAIACKCGGLPVLDETPNVYITPAEVSAVDALNLPPRYVVVHCTSNQDVRDWDTTKWRQFTAELMSRHDIAVVEVGLAPLVQSNDQRYLNLCGKLSILQTAEVIRRAAVFIGIDSGPAHLANAVGAPGVILLGHYRWYTRYMPYSGAYACGEQATILYADGPASTLPVERVIQAVNDRLTAVPAGAASPASPASAPSAPPPSPSPSPSPSPAAPAETWGGRA